MQKPLAGKKVAILVANGFNEMEMTTFQRGVLEAGATPKIISTENGLTNGWQGTNWGHYFAVEIPLSDALAADFDILVIPGGSRSHDKLKLTAHTRRFIGGFLAAHKPIVLLSDAAHLLVATNQANGIMLNAPENFAEEINNAGGTFSADSPTLHYNVISAQPTAENLPQLVETLINFVLDEQESAEQIAA
jgi:protease I